MVPARKPKSKNQKQEMATMLLDFVVPGAGTLLTLVLAAKKMNTLAQSNKLKEAGVKFFQIADKNNDQTLSPQELRDFALRTGQWFQENASLQRTSEFKTVAKQIKFFFKIIEMAIKGGGGIQDAAMKAISASFEVPDEVGMLVNLFQTKAREFSRPVTLQQFTGALDRYFQGIAAGLLVEAIFL